MTDILNRSGFSHEETAYVWGSELIMRFRKIESAAEQSARLAQAPAASAG